MNKYRVIALLAVGVCSVKAWTALNDLVAHALVYAKTGWLGEAYRPWFWLHASWAMAAVIVVRSGLLDSKGLRGWLGRFKLSLLARDRRDLDLGPLRFG
jgi:hypothetical protein